MIDLLGSGLLSLFAFVAVISFVVVLHELGHYWAGRLFGVHAEVFSIGMGPGLFGWTDRLGTRWVVAALPLGGYVRFRGDENAASAAPGRDELDQLRRDHDAPETVFHFKPVWQRAIIVAAGPVMNFVLAVALFAAIGVMRGEAYIEPRVGMVAEDGAAARAGFEPGDRIVAIDGRRTDNFFDVMQSVSTRAGVEMTFTVERGGERLDLQVTPERRMREDGLGGERGLGFIGVGVSPQADRGRERVGLLSAPAYGVERTAETVSMIGDYLVRLVTGRASLEHINGPLGIATTAGQLANNAVDAPAGAGAERAGSPLGAQLANLALALLTLSALLSVALGLMNLLPIPVLDGGHLVYYGYEAVAGRPPSPAVQETGFRLGLGLILCMLVVATWNDLSYLRGLFS